MINKKIAKKLNNIKPVEYIDRETGIKQQENIPGEAWIKWLYNFPLGQITLETIIKRKAVSSFYGKLMNKRQSKKKIKPFIEIFNINTEDSLEPVSSFRTFNEFFARKIKSSSRVIDKKPDTVVSPADGRIFVYSKMQKEDTFFIKGYQFSLYELIKNKKIAGHYEDATVFIIRLGPTDYHRFHFPLDCVPEKPIKIRGKYYSVSPISLRKKKSLCKNKRFYSVLHNEKINDLIMVEVGATLVGSIGYTYLPFRQYAKGEERGFFSFGASTVVLVFRKNSVVIDDDILLNSQLGYETSIRMGERIGKLVY